MYDFISIDFETANNDMTSACSLGIAVVKDLEIVNTEYYLINPLTKVFNSDNIAIHGITYDDVKECDSFDILWDHISHYFNNIVIAHNSQFDMSVLKNLFNAYSLPHDNFTYLDSIMISNSVCGCGTGLSDRASYFGIDEGIHHNALDDAITCARIVISSVMAYGCNSFLQFAIKYDKLSSKDIDNIKANKTFLKKSKLPDYVHLNLSNMAAATTDFNTNHPFYGKNIVLTGELNNFSRPDAIQKILDVGGIVKSSVSKKIDYLIVGVQDINLVGSDGMSSKEEKAYELNNNGCNIQIINEEEFMKLLY